MPAELPSAPLVLAGSGRSGTTWILDVLAELNGLRPVFEPLHPDAVPLAEPWANRFIGADEQLPELERFLEQVCSGRFSSLWTDYRIRQHMLIPRARNFSSPGLAKALWLEWKSAAARIGRYRPMRKNSPALVKIIRGNLMLGWLRKRLDARIVFVARHPGAVVESRLRISGPSWDPEPMIRGLRESDRLGPLQERYDELLHSKLEPAEAHTLIWCMENQLPLERAEVEGYTVVYYEQLLSDSERQWQRIVDTFGLQLNPFDADIVTKPSQQSALARRKKHRGAKTSWQERIDPAQREDIQRILERTGVTVYHVDSMAPVNTG